MQSKFVSTVPAYLQAIRFIPNDQDSSLRSGISQLPVNEERKTGIKGNRKLNISKPWKRKRRRFGEADHPVIHDTEDALTVFTSKQKVLVGDISTILQPTVKEPLPKEIFRCSTVEQILYIYR